MKRKTAILLFVMVLLLVLAIAILVYSLIHMRREEIARYEAGPRRLSELKEGVWIDDDTDVLSSAFAMLEENNESVDYYHFTLVEGKLLIVEVPDTLEEEYRLFAKQMEDENPDRISCKLEGTAREIRADWRALPYALAAAENYYGKAVTQENMDEYLWDVYLEVGAIPKGRP